MAEKKLAVGYWVEYWDKDYHNFSGGEVLSIKGNSGGWIDVEIRDYISKLKTIPDFLIKRTRTHTFGDYESYPFFSEAKAHD